VETLRQLPELGEGAILEELKSDGNLDVREGVLKPDPEPRDFRKKRQDTLRKAKSKEDSTAPRDKQ